jgi:methyl-accepting chemotaxis protein
MNKVASSAKGTDAVIGGLDKIAFQTRVLAMNAAVEAGRAGDAGRGFAVVADLVSALALRAEEEAKSARDQLTTTQAEIVVALAAVQNVDGTLQEIATDVGEVNTLLNGMVADNQAQSLAVSEIASAVSSMDRATQQNAAMVEETSAAAANLSTIVNVMMEHSKNFRFERRVHSTPVAVDRRARGRREVWSPEARAANSSTRRPERVDA